MFEAFERGYTTEEVVELTGIFEWYTERYKRIADSTLAAQEGDFTEAAIAGHTNATIASAAGADIDTVEARSPGAPTNRSTPVPASSKPRRHTTTPRAKRVRVRP